MVDYANEEDKGADGIIELGGQELEVLWSYSSLFSNQPNT